MCENYDHDVLVDLEECFSRLVLDGAKWMQYVLEGLDDMPAHIRSVLTQTSMIIPINADQLELGRWQGVFGNTG